MVRSLSFGSYLKDFTILFVFVFTVLPHKLFRLTFYINSLAHYTKGTLLF
jgi:hypothetical protein